MKRKKFRCSVCGARCDNTWGRHVYGIVVERRCSQECANCPVVDTELRDTLVRMGDVVLEARGVGAVGRALAKAFSS